MTEHDRPHQAPPASRPLLWLAGALLLVPILALVPVGWYARDEPELFGFPFFIWYQLAWVFLCAAFTFAAYLVVQKARPHVPMRRVDRPQDGHR